MKRFFASAFIILIFPLIISFNSYAVDKQNLIDYIEDTKGVTVNITDYSWNKFQEFCVLHPDYDICIINDDYYGLVATGNFIPQSNQFRIRNPYGRMAKNAVSGSVDYVTGDSAFNMSNDMLLAHFDSFSDLVEDTKQIDFDSIYYSTQIPVPEIEVFMDNDNYNPSSGQAIWNASFQFGDNSNFYIQYGYKASFPSYIEIGLASLKGDYSYNYYNYTSTDYIDIVDMQSLTVATNQGKGAAYFQSSWQSFYDDYLLDSLLPEFGTQINAMNQTMVTQASEYYKNYMMTQIPMYGNRLEIFARYFTVDDQSRVVVGAWNHWSSKDGSRTKERPSNYIDNVALPGYINTNNDPDYQDNSDTYNTIGDATGTPATIINNNYAPNYPDYPTVVTYNHDNILLNFMDTAKQLPSFFGEFTSFLTVAFAFIPSWIWAIIGTGFTFSIVIMIIKVL